MQLLLGRLHELQAAAIIDIDRLHLVGLSWVGLDSIREGNLRLPANIETNKL
jgi:hypothetical protein